MLSTLRSRYILSHLLPTLLMVPLLGLALIYVVETQVLLPRIQSEIVGEANLVADISSAPTSLGSVWSSETAAESFVSHVSPDVASRITLISTSGRLLASSDPADAPSIAQPVDDANLYSALDGETSTSTEYDQRLGREVYDVLVPARDASGHILGVVRLTRTLDSVPEQLIRMRFLILGVLAGGLLLSTALGLELALRMERPLRRLTAALLTLTTGERLTLLRERGPDEVELLVGAYNSLVERLSTVEESRRLLLSSLVHELGRPLGALRSSNQALLRLEDDDPAVRRELLLGTEDELKHLERLLDDLSQLHGQLPEPLGLTKIPIALGHWLSSTLTPWRVMAGAKGLTWHAEVPSRLPTVAIDPDRLAQALGNLLSNAVRYTPAGGTISVRVKLENGDVVVRVRDTGPGIAPEERERVFGAFYRGSASANAARGMGLGLAIARDIVREHGGSLGVEYPEGPGATFALRLPARTPKADGKAARVRPVSSG